MSETAAAAAANAAAPKCSNNIEVCTDYVTHFEIGGVPRVAKGARGMLHSW